MRIFLSYLKIEGKECLTVTVTVLGPGGNPHCNLKENNILKHPLLTLYALNRLSGIRSFCNMLCISKQVLVHNMIHISGINH